MNLTKSQIFLICLLAFINGVAIRSFFVIDNFVVFCLFVGALLLIVIARSNYSNSGRRSNLQVLALLLILLSAGITRYQLAQPKEFPEYEKKITFIGIIVKEPDERISNIKYTIGKWHIANSEWSAKGKVLITTNLYPRYNYGDKLEVTCKLQQPESFEGFAYDRYLARYDIYTVCYYPKIKLLEKGQGSYVLSKILNIKSYLKNQVNENLPEPQASLFNAIILGSRRGIPQELYENFAADGAAHLIAISGLHITIITAILMSLFNNLYISRKRSFYIITLFLIFYLVIIGFPASAVRASIMAWLMLLAYQLGRLNTSSRALVFVATAMILINPKILRDDIGFQLSFLAVLGIIYFSPYFEKWLKKVPDGLGFKSILVMTFSAQVMTLPVVLYNFGRLSVISPVTNILLLPILPYLMILAFITLSLSIALSLNIIWWPVWILFTYIIKVIEVLAKIPLASVDFKISGLILILLYIMIFLFLKKKSGNL